MVARARVLLAVSAATLACVTLGGPTVPDDEADKLRQQLARAPDDPRRASVMEELAKLELERARRANTILAYKRFLDEFPLGEEADTARALLEDLRFQAAQGTGTIAAWEAFLEESPRGKHAPEARAALGALEIDAALASSDLMLARRTLGRFPDHPRREALAAHEDNLAWDAARPKGSDAIDAYLEAHPNGAHRLEALHLREQNEEASIEESEDLDRARAQAARADATEEQRVVVAAIELRRALRALDLTALKKLAASTSVEPRVAAVSARAKEFVESVSRHPFSEAVSAALAGARADGSLGEHSAVVAGVDVGDPLDRVAALRKLAEWGDPDDVRVVTGALDSEYVAVRLAAVETLRALGQALRPPVWRQIEHARESEALSKELTASTWRRIAALREADGRPVEAAAAWRAAIEQDGSDLAARARVFALARQTGDRLAQTAAARELSKAAVDFGDGRWTPPKPGEPGQPADHGRLVSMPGGQTVLRQICTAIELGTLGAQTLGTLAADAAPQEQQLLTLARTDAEGALDRLRTRQAELEKTLRAQQPGIMPCGADPATAVIERSRQRRADALGRIGALGDARLLPFVEGLTYTPGPQVKAAAQAAAESLRRIAAQPLDTEGTSKHRSASR
jgi:hypothetical protein